MTTFTKNYIGKGTQVNGMDIVKIFIQADKLNECTFEMDGTKYVGFEIAKMLKTDKFGRTHTVYFSQKVKASAEPDAKKSRKRKGEHAN
jgi:hypothetical protein